MNDLKPPYISQWDEGKVQRCFLNLNSVCFLFTLVVYFELTPSVWDLAGLIC